MFANYSRNQTHSPSSFKDFLVDYNNHRYNANHSSDRRHSDGNSVTDINSHYNCWQYVFKLIVIIGCALGCGWQCISILNLFFSFPSIVFVYVETMDQLELPGITLCNSNRFVL